MVKDALQFRNSRHLGSVHPICSEAYKFLFASVVFLLPALSSWQGDLNEVYAYMYVVRCAHMCVYVYTHKQREKERERERTPCVCISYRRLTPIRVLLFLSDFSSVGLLGVLCLLGLRDSYLRSIRSTRSMWSLRSTKLIRSMSFSGPCRPAPGRPGTGHPGTRHLAPSGRHPAPRYLAPGTRHPAQDYVQQSATQLTSSPSILR